MNEPEPATTSNNSSEAAGEGPIRWAGVDWSWSEHAVCVIDDSGAAIERFTVPHTAPGLSTLVTALHRHQVTGVAIERGDGPVVAALLDAGLTVFVIAARQVTALRNRYGTARNKDDRFDAYLLADVLRTDRRRLTPLSTDTDATVGLRMLIRARANLVKARVAAHNQLRAHLQLAHPGAVGLFHDLDGKISLAFIERFPTPRHTSWLSEKRLAAWLKAARYTRPNTRTPAQLLDHLRHAPAGHPDGPATNAAQIITAELVALLRSLRDRITALETGIEQALAGHADGAVFTSLPRSGSVRAATLLAEIGDARGRFPTDDAVTPPPPTQPNRLSRPPQRLRDQGRRRFSIAASTSRPQSVSRLAEGHPQGPGLDTDEDGGTLEAPENDPEVDMGLSMAVRRAVAQRRAAPFTGRAAVSSSRGRRTARRQAVHLYSRPRSPDRILSRHGLRDRQHQHQHPHPRRPGLGADRGRTALREVEGS